MAKKKVNFGFFKCSECKLEAYLTKISKETKRLELKKYCTRCNKHTLHKLKRKD